METLTSNGLDEILKELEKVSEEIRAVDQGGEKWSSSQRKS